jgi:hypothetical protein
MFGFMFPRREAPAQFQPWQQPQQYQRYPQNQYQRQQPQPYQYQYQQRRPGYPFYQDR